MLDALNQTKIDWDKLRQASKDVSDVAGDQCNLRQTVQNTLNPLFDRVSGFALNDSIKSTFELEALLIDYRKKGVPLPYDRISTLAGLTQEIDALYAQWNQARKDSDETLVALNDKVALLIKSTSNPDTPDTYVAGLTHDVSALRAQARTVGAHMGDIAVRISRVLSVFDDFECQTLNSSTCREFKI